MMINSGLLSATISPGTITKYDTRAFETDGDTQESHETPKAHIRTQDGDPKVPIHRSKDHNLLHYTS